MTLVECVFGFLFVAAVTAGVVARGDITAIIVAAWSATRDDFPVIEVDRGEIR